MLHTSPHSALLLAAIFTATGCSDGGSYFDEPDSGTAIERDMSGPDDLVRIEFVDPPESVPYGDTVRFDLVGFDVRDREVPVETPVWEALNERLELVSNDRFEAVDVGRTGVRVTEDGVSAVVELDVVAQRIGGIGIGSDGRSLPVGATVPFVVELFGPDGLPYETPEEVEITIEALDPSVLTIDLDAMVVEGVSPGTGRVRASAGEHSVTYTLEVFEYVMTEITIRNIDSVVRPGESGTFFSSTEWEPTFPDGGFISRTTSSNPEVLSVEGTTWRALKEGEATLTMRVEGQDPTSTQVVTVDGRADDIALGRNTILAVWQGDVLGLAFGFNGQPLWRSETQTLADLQSVEAGADHYCGLDSMRRVFCWGLSVDGEAGSFQSFVGSPAQIPDLQNVDRLFLTLRRSCAVSDGITKCWGKLQNLASRTPVEVPYRAAVVTHDWECRARTDGTTCEGDNSEGQLGIGARSAMGMGLVDTSERFVELVAGLDFTCGLTDAGAAWCWGDGDFGQLGAGLYLDASSPVAVAGGHTFAAITAGHEHVCGLDNDGLVWCWGSNEEGQLGDGTPQGSAVPVRTASVRTFVTIEASGRRTCALDAVDDEVWCWGERGVSWPVPRRFPL